MSRRLIALACSAALLALPAGATGDDILLPLVKRAFMLAADARCHVLDDATTQALRAGYLQARNTALRSGYTFGTLQPWLQKASDAGARVDCASTPLTQEVATAQGAYRRFMAVPRLELASGRTTWLADRGYSRNTQWRLVQYQQTAEADLAFGIYGTLGTNSFSVMAHFNDGAKPYTARLLVRNPDVQAQGFIDRSPYAVTTARPFGFDASSDLIFMASGAGSEHTVMQPVVKANSAGFSLTGEYVGTQETVDAVRFDFPKTAWTAMAKLDPREDVVVEFDSDTGPTYARFEVGDFLTGLGYIALPTPYSS